MHLAGYTSTGSKRPDILFGPDASDVPLRMRRSEGCRLWDDAGREYLDFVMSLGAVSLGYGHPAITQAVMEAISRGGIGSLAPVDEELLAEDLYQINPVLEQVRFLKTGAEAVAAAVRLARVATGREQVLGCGYHGWLDWCSRSAGVPTGVQALFSEIPFNNIERSSEAIRAVGDRLAAVVIEPVVNEAPSIEWLQMLRHETAKVGALLIYDEIKTGFRVGLSGAAGRWGGDPDLILLGKAMANGFPLAAVGGKYEVMKHVSETWISSTMATEFVSITAARATLHEIRERDVPHWLNDVGGRLFAGLQDLASKYPQHIESAAGISEMCHLNFRSEQVSFEVARRCAFRGLLFKRTGYNFVSLAHASEDVDRALAILDEVLRQL